MTEVEWLACEDAAPMLAFLGEQGRASDRKLRLFSCACARRAWHLMTDDELRQGFEVVERLADGYARLRDRIETAKAAERLQGKLRDDARQYQLACELKKAARKTVTKRATLLGRGPSAAFGYFAGGCPTRSGFFPAMAAERKQQAALMREIFGAFLPCAAPGPTCRKAVQPLAQAAYDERHLPGGHLDNARLAILSDALEEAGCTDEAILSHLRSPGPHVRGCWALDLLLGRE